MLIILLIVLVSIFFGFYPVHNKLDRTLAIVFWLVCVSAIIFFGVVFPLI